MSYSTVSSTYHIWLHFIATDEMLVEKQKEIEVLQMKIESLNVQLMKREGSDISRSMEKMKGK